MWPQGDALEWREMGALRAGGSNWICLPCSKLLREAGGGFSANSLRHSSSFLLCFKAKESDLCVVLE